MRHSFRALRYAGVSHNDEEARNILCPPLSQETAIAPGIVILDFAHSELWLADSDGTPPTYRNAQRCPHFRPLLVQAGISDQLVEEFWEPLEEIEF